jgi:hypothetical protein
MRADKNHRAHQKDQEETMSGKELSADQKAVLVDTVTGYEHYAPYFINGDPSGLSDSERQDADCFLGRIRWEYGDDAYITDASDSARFSFPEYGGLYGSVVTYTVSYTRNRSFR